MRHREGTCCSLPREFVQLVLVLTFGLRLHFGSSQVSDLVLRVLVRFFFFFLKLFMYLFFGRRLYISISRDNSLQTRRSLFVLVMLRAVVGGQQCQSVSEL